MERPSLISESFNVSNFYAVCMSVLRARVCAPSVCLLPAEVRRELPESLELEFQTAGAAMCAVRMPPGSSEQPEQ